MKKKNPKTFGLLVIYAFYTIAYVIGGLSVYLLRNNVNTTELQLLLFTAVATLVIYICSVFVKNTSVYDAYWSLTPMIMVTYLFLINIRTVNVYHIILFAVFLFWSVRLTLNWSKTFDNLEIEDWRYSDFRKKLNPFLFEVVNFFGLQFMPTILVYFGFVPLVSFFSKSANAWSLFGSAIILIGTLFELFADISMHQHLKESPSGQVNKKGLWKYSRHPNYFGEVLIWIGIYVALVVTEPSLWRLGLGALLIVLLFEFISIPLAEARHRKRRPDYATYIKETSRMIPLPNRSK